MLYPGRDERGAVRFHRGVVLAISTTAQAVVLRIRDALNLQPVECGASRVRLLPRDHPDRLVVAPAPPRTPTG